MSYTTKTALCFLGLTIALASGRVVYPISEEVTGYPEECRCAPPPCADPVPPADGQCCPTCPEVLEREPRQLVPVLVPVNNCPVPLSTCSGSDNPCLTASCPGVANAVCTVDYCGCKAMFFTFLNGVARKQSPSDCLYY